MQSFHVADLNAHGEIHSVQEHCYDSLQQIPGCLELIARFSGMLYPHPSEFELELGRGKEAVIFRWNASSPTSGIATTRLESQLLSFSVLAAGVSAAADEITLGTFQTRIVRELHDSGYEPAFGLLELKVRPVVATMTISDPAVRANQMIVALADRCFAASYFRYLRLV